MGDELIFNNEVHSEDVLLFVGCMHAKVTSGIRIPCKLPICVFQTCLKKKIKYAEIDFTSHHSFLRLRKVKKINLKLPHTKKTQPNLSKKKNKMAEKIKMAAKHTFSIA
jgi:hypothetical protein